MIVRLAGVVNESVTDGPGLRIAFFFQGCHHHCPGCHNPQTWDFAGGTDFDVQTLIQQTPDSPLIQGITLSGGDPFYQAAAAATIAREYKSRGKNIWAYTGFTWEQLIQENNPDTLALLNLCDVLVDGPFIQTQMNLGLPFRGSANQRLINVSDSLAQKTLIVL